MGRCGLILLALVGCTPPPLDVDGQARQLLLHRAEAGASVSGAPEAWLQGSGLQAVEEAGEWLVTTGSEVEPDQGMDLVWAAGDPLLETHRPIAAVGPWRLWQQAGPAPPWLALEALPEEASALQDEVFVGERTLGAVAGQAWTAELYLRLPARVPLDLCLELETPTGVRSGGALFDGVPVAWPGLEERPLLRHRLRLPLDGPVPASARLVLTDCSTGSRVYAGPTVELRASTTVPTLDELRARPGTPAVEWDPTQRAHERRAFRQTAAGLVPMDAPPLPRIQVGEAVAVLVGGELDLSRVDPEAPERALAGVQGFFASAQGAVASLVSPVSRVGVTHVPDTARPPLRAQPEVLGALDGLHLDGLLSTTSLLDASRVGFAATRAHLGARGVDLAGWPDHPVLALDTAAKLPDGVPGDDAPRVAVVALTLAPTPGAPTVPLPGETLLPWLTEQVEAARTWADVVLAAVEPGEAALDSFVADLHAAGLDGAWVLRDELGAVVVHDGMPVLDGLPPLLADEQGPLRRAALLRLVLDRQGIRRMDVLPTVQSRGRLDWEEEGARQRLEGLAERSLQLGTDVRVGTNLATSEVRDHWPAGPARAAPSRPPPPAPSAMPVLPKQLPVRCQGTAPEDGGTSVALEGVSIVDVELPPAPVEPGSWVELALSWVAEEPLPTGEVLWAVEGPGRTWRAVSVPCEGSWSFSDFEPGVVVRDPVLLWVPLETDEGSWTLTASVKLADGVRRTLADERRFEVGTLLVTRADGEAAP